ncbi:hypothetical protein ACFL35_09840 [Candidatus Riflebacteria bacterium]
MNDYQNDSEIEYPDIDEIKDSTKKLPLDCPDCGSPIPLKGAEWTECPYCQKKVRVPDDYAEVVISQQLIQENKQEALEFMADIGKPPGTFGRLIARIPIILYVFFLSFYGYSLKLVCNSIFFENFLRYYEFSLHLNPYDAAYPWQLTLFDFGPFFLMLAAPISVIYYLRIKLDSLHHLHFILAASPPALEGGPLTCRNCGAPLDVPDDVPGVLCTYCSTENLVSLPSDWVDSNVREAHSTIEDLNNAIEVYNENTSSYLRIIFYLFAIFTFFALFYFMDYRYLRAKTYPGTYRKALRNRKQLLTSDEKNHINIPLNRTLKRKDVKKIADQYFVPLAYREKLKIALKRDYRIPIRKLQAKIDAAEKKERKEYARKNVTYYEPNYIYSYRQNLRKLKLRLKRKTNKGQELKIKVFKLNNSFDRLFESTESKHLLTFTSRSQKSFEFESRLGAWYQLVFKFPDDVVRLKARITKK